MIPLGPWIMRLPVHPLAVYLRPIQERHFTGKASTGGNNLLNKGDPPPLFIVQMFGFNKEPYILYNSRLAL